MKIIIMHSKTKREINGSFNICGSRKDLLELAEQIRRKVHCDFFYGWVSIEDRCLDVNAVPVSWDEQGGNAE